MSTLRIRFRQWRECRRWAREQIPHLLTLLHEDSRWMASDPTAAALTARYLDALREDWYRVQFDGVSELRDRLGLNPHRARHTEDLPSRAKIALDSECLHSPAMFRNIVRELLNENERLNGLINTPETDDFLRGVQLEAAHQVQRWGYAHDRSKSAENWFWLVGYLAGKALRAAISADQEKAKHHTISSAAALKNWHSAISNDTSGAGIGQDEDLRAKNPVDAQVADAATVAA
jgi:hypothetical protein